MKKIINKVLLAILIMLIVMIVPNYAKAANVSVAKVKSVKVITKETTSLKLSWKKVSKATAYRVYVYNNSKNKYEYVAKAKSNTYILKNLKSSQKYKIKIRAYRTVNNKKYFGAYSSVLTTNTKPTQVINLKVTAQADTSLTLSWNKVARATGYKVYLYNETTKKYDEKATVSSNLAKITGLIQSQTYKIRVRAFKTLNNKKSYGAYSTVISTFTVPSKIYGVKVSSSSISSIKLTWNSISRVDGYSVYKYNASSKAYEKVINTTKNEYEITGLDPATGYNFKVRAYKLSDGIKHYGAYSDILGTATLPNKVTDLKVSGVSENSIQVTWSKVDKASGYAVYVYNQKSQSFKKYKTTTSNSMKITDLDAARFYKIYVKAYATIDGVNYYSKASNTISKKTNSTKTEIAGIDVSSHNATINWEKVKKAGVDFAIIRCGFGQDDDDQDDKYFERNISECERLGIPYGVYLYSYALNTKHAESEADHALRLLKGHTPKYGVWFDMEDADNYKKNHGMPENNVLVDICDTFCKKMIKNGYKTGIYASLSWFNNQLNNSKLDKYEKWVAQWNEKCSYTKDYVMWQYTSDGMVDGISGRVDMNIMYLKVVE